MRTDASKEALIALGGIVQIREEEAPSAGAEMTYEIELEDGADSQVFLAKAVEARLSISRFEEAGATLHDIFVSLAGDEVGDGVSSGKKAATHDETPTRERTHEDAA